MLDRIMRTDEEFWNWCRQTNKQIRPKKLTTLLAKKRHVIEPLLFNEEAYKKAERALQELK